MNTQLYIALVIFGFVTVSLGAPAASSTASPKAPSPPTDASNGSSNSAPPTSGTVSTSPTKPEYPKDLGNGVEMINREDCPGGYCETFLVRPPPPGVGYPMPMGMGGMGMGGMGMPRMGSSNPCCPQLPPSPCGGMQQPSCQLRPPPQGCNSPCPPPPMMG